MSLRFVEGFDAYDTGILPAVNLWDSASGVVIVGDAGRSGFAGDNAAFFDTSLDSILRKTISPVIQGGVYTVTQGIAVQVVTLATTATLLTVNTSLSAFDLKMTTWGSLELYQTTGGVPFGLVCQSADGLVPIGTGGVYVELRLIFTAGLASACQIRMSDQYGEMNPVAQGALLATLVGAPSTELVIGGGVGEDPATWYVDDIYVTDGVPAVTPVNYRGQNLLNDGYLGNTHIATFYMTADGVAQTIGNTPWVPDTGSSVYSRIDEHPPDEDASYATADTIDQRSTGLYASPTQAPFGRQGCCAYAPIYGLAWLGRMRVDSGSITVVPLVRRVVGGTFATDIVEVGTDIVLSDTAYLYYPQILERDPTNGNAPFTFAAFFPAGVGVPGTLEFGIQKTA